MSALGTPRGEYLQEIRSPEGVEEVAGADFFFTVVLPQVEEFKHIGVPGLKINCKSTGALVATLVHVTCSGVVRSEHRHDAVGIAVGSGNVGAKR
jgi:hypothetical protein